MWLLMSSMCISGICCKGLTMLCFGTPSVVCFYIQVVRIYIIRLMHAYITGPNYKVLDLSLIFLFNNLSLWERFCWNSYNECMCLKLVQSNPLKEEFTTIGLPCVFSRSLFLFQVFHPLRMESTTVVYLDHVVFQPGRTSVQISWLVHPQVTMESLLVR